MSKANILNNFFLNNNSKLNQSYINIQKLKRYQLTKLYKIINLQPHSYCQNIYTLKLISTSNYSLYYKINIKIKKVFKKIYKLMLKTFNKFKFLKLKQCFNFKNLNIQLKPKHVLILKYGYFLNFTVKYKKMVNNKIKNIYNNKWWFYFLKRIYPYISINFFDFKLYLLLKKIFRLLINVNLKNIYKIFFKLTFINNLNIFFNNKYILLFLNYKKLLILTTFYNLKKVILSNSNFYNIKNWLKVQYKFNLKFINLFYNYNMLTIFYINFIFKKYLFFKIFNIYLNYLILFIYNKFLYLKNKLTYFSNIEIYYDLIKYQDNSKLFIAITPQNLIMTINRRYKKGLE
jgi:hypothetical protein